MSLDPKDVSAIIVTRGDVDLDPILETLPYDDVIVWDNSKKKRDWGVFGRYKAIEQAKNPVIYWQDDDVIFRNHEQLLEKYKPGKLVANMWDEWVHQCGYWDLALGGMGSLCDRDLPAKVFQRYADAGYSTINRFFRLQCDFIFGVLVPWERWDFGIEILDVASAPDRLWRQPNQMHDKWQAIKRARSLRKVCLAMMVKNEAKNLERAVKSAEGLYDELVVVDTGSDDDTVDIAWKLGALIHKRPWVNFAHNRTELLELAAQHGDYILMMDGDEELIDRPKKWQELAADAYQLHYDGPYDYSQPRLIRSGIPWRFEGKVHGYLSPGDYLARLEDLQHPKIVHHGEGRHADRKIKRDIQVLTEMWKEDLGDARSILLLAQALEALGQHELAIDLYRLRVSMEGWEEEQWWAQLQVGRLLGLSDFNAASEELMKAYRMRPWRIEPLRILAIYANDVADQAPYPEQDVLYIHREHYATKGK